jgi:hypothetical protein
MERRVGDTDYLTLWLAYVELLNPEIFSGTTNNPAPYAGGGIILTARLN